eukprot:4806891-Heterocapsa_arctica.AAC.1
MPARSCSTSPTPSTTFPTKTPTSHLRHLRQRHPTPDPANTDSEAPLDNAHFDAPTKVTIDEKMKDYGSLKITTQKIRKPDATNKDLPVPPPAPPPGLEGGCLPLEKTQMKVQRTAVSVGPPKVHSAHIEQLRVQSAADILYYTIKQQKILRTAASVEQKKVYSARIEQLEVQSAAIEQQ